VSGVVLGIGDSDLLSRLVGIVFSEGGRCAGDDERARCEGARAIDRSLLNEGCFSLAFAWDAAAAAAAKHCRSKGDRDN
jgi:hypothetical protein